MERLRVTEIFFSLQGETKTVGIPTIFIRLTGCPLRCHYCDTSYAFSGGKWFSIEEILSDIQKYRTQHITVTGGEPLAQKACYPLLTTLCDHSYQVGLETSGALDVSEVDKRVCKILDIKTPGSGEVEKNKWKNLDCLNPQDQIKFVICGEKDYEWAKQTIAQFQLLTRCEVLFSPSYHDLSAQELAEWILRDQLKVRFQLQLHKYLWGDVPGR